jgi:hypothetical protein
MQLRDACTCGSREVEERVLDEVQRKQRRPSGVERLEDQLRRVVPVQADRDNLQQTGYRLAQGSEPLRDLRRVCALRVRIGVALSAEERPRLVHRVGGVVRHARSVFGGFENLTKCGLIGARRPELEPLVAGRIVFGMP